MNFNSYHNSDIYRNYVEIRLNPDITAGCGWQHSRIFGNGRSVNEDLEIKMMKTLYSIITRIFQSQKILIGEF